MLGRVFGGGTSRMEEVCIKLYIDEEKEPYILNRLYREGRREIMKIRENRSFSTRAFFDTNEMLLSWVKTLQAVLWTYRAPISFHSQDNP